MRDAATTWALVAGIDTYDHQPHLTGAAADAVATVGWLRRLGVPDPQILLHAAPCAATAPSVAALGLAYGGCTEPEIWKSFEKLWNNSGTRLFVFLSGHGFYEPEGHRVFLTREASQRAMANLGIEWYARLLQGMPYTRQFLVMDGCLNLPYSTEERKKFEPGQHTAVRPDPVRPEVLQWLCVSAGIGQRALERHNRGLFHKTLIDTLNLDKPNPFCATIDDTNGTIELDLARAVELAVAPLVTELAGAEGRVQTPGIVPLVVPSPPTVAVARIEPEATTTVTLDVTPRKAVAGVDRIRLASKEFRWSTEVPDTATAVLACPVERVLPRSMRFTAECVVADDALAQPQSQSFTTATDTWKVRFNVKPAGGRRKVVVNVVDRRGITVPRMNKKAYSGVRRVLHREGVTFEDHETGPVLLNLNSGYDERSVALTCELAKVINERTARAVSAVVRGVDARNTTTSVRVALTREAMLRLVGLLGDHPVVRIGDETYTPARLVDDPVVVVQPGVVPVEVTLPWGRWADLAHVEAGAQTDVALPESVGLPPLRVKLLNDPGAGDWPARTVVAAAPLRGPFVRAETSRLWRSAASSSRYESDAPRWRAVVTIKGVGGTYAFPLNEQGALGVQPFERAEPLSSTDSPAWDSLVASGRLVEVSAEDAVGLTNQKWKDLLLGVAGAYACYAQRADDYLGRVLANIRDLDPDMPDVTVLAAARDRRLGVTDEGTAERLRAVEESGAVPVFRWGLSAAALAADHYGLAGLAERMRAVDARAVQTSVWTMWSVGRAPRRVVG